MSDWSGFEVIDDTPPVAKSEGATWNDFEVESEDSQGWEGFEVQEPERERVEFGGGATMVMDPVAERTPLAPPPEDSGGVLDTTGDFGLSVGKGSVGLLSDIGGLIGDLGNRNEDLNVTAARERYGMPGAGQAIRDSGKEGKKYLTSLMSEAGQFSDKKVAQQIEQLGEEGFVMQVFGSVGIYLNEPRALLNGIGESLPSMIPSTTAARATAATLLAARGLVPGSKAATAYLATKPAMARLASAAAVGEGTASGLSTYSTARDAGKSIEEAGGYALAAGVGTAAIGRFASKWIPDVEAELGRALAGGKAAAEGIKGAARNIMRGAISEGALQEFPQSIQEQIWANLAEDKPWDEGLGTAGGSGFVMGMGMGAGTQTMAEAVSLATGVPTTDSLNEALNKPANAGPVAAGMTARLDDGFGTVDDVTVVEELSDTTVRIRRSDGSEQLAGRDLLTPTGPAPTAPAAGPGSPADITEDPFSSNLAAQNAARQAEIDSIMGGMELPDTGTSNLTEQMESVPAPRFAVSPAERAATPQLGARGVGTDGNPIADTPQQREINERRAPSASAFVQAERDAEARRAADEADFEFQTLRERALGRVEQEQEKGPVTLREMAAKVRAKKEAAAEPDIEPDTEATGANAPANPAMAEAMKAAQDTKRNETVRQAVGRRQGGLGDQVQATGEPVRRQAGFGEDMPALEDTPLGEGSVPGFARPRADEKNVGQETPDVDFAPQQGEAPIFKTKLEGLVNERLGKQVPAAQLSQMIKAWTKKGEVKPEEIDTLKIQEWADSQEGKVTKQQVLDFIAENAPQMNESLKGTDNKTPSIEELRKAYVDEFVRERYWLDKDGDDWVVMDNHPEYGDMVVATLNDEEAASYGADPKGDTDVFLRAFTEAEVADLGPESILEQLDFDGDNPTKYGSYTQPGGENYKELLITRGGKVLEDYTSSHWGEKNVLAHVRFDTREQDGKKTLFIEEVQSDMHQDGRKKGYDAPKTRAELDKLAKDEGFSWNVERTGELISNGAYPARAYVATPTPNQDGKYDLVGYNRGEEMDKGVPDAPFKKSWPMLAMKRMIRYAAENGFERISWATGAMNADLYSLRESVRSIEYNKTGDGEWMVTAKGVRSADPVIEKTGQSESDLEGLLGKEIASKIVNDEGTRAAGEPEGYGVLSGEGLDVGGEGMSAFYDKILPNEIKKYAKKFGVKVEAKPITIPRSGEPGEKFTYYNTPDGILIMDPEGFTEEVLDNDTPMEKVRARLRELNEERFGLDDKDVLGFDMTDALKAEALAGQPMFAPVQGKKGKPDIAGENREGVIVGARPGEAGWKVNRPDVTPPPISHPASKAPRVENIAAAMAKIFKSKKFNDFIAEAFGIKGIDVYATLGSFLGKPEPSFVIHGDGLTFEQADALSRFLGVMFAQDAMFVTQPVTSGGNGVALYIGKGKRLTKAQIEAVRDASMEVGLDYTTTVDGTAFKFFPEDSNKLDEFYEKVATVSAAANLGTPQQITVRTEYYGSEDYLSGDAGSAEREAWIQESTDGTPGLFGRAVDGVLVPYARAVAAEGYRFSPDRFAHKFGLTDAQRDTIREALRAKRGKNISTAGILKGDEKIEIDATGKVVRGTATATVADVLWGLQNRAANVGQIEPGDHSKQAERVISDVIADEVAHHVSRPEGKSAIGWYDASLKKAKELYAKVFPEIATDADRNLFFDAILGIASQGNTVVDNARYAGRVYHLVTREGMSIKEAVAALKGSFGEQSNAIETNMLKLAALLEQNGYDTMRALFNTTMTVGEWNAKLRADKNLHVNGSPLKMAGAARQTVTGWMVFGPKIGSFINNLHGDYTTLTADLWFTRTWNRILGFAFLHAPQTEADKYQAFKDALVAEAGMDSTPKKVAKNGKKTFWQHGNDLNNPNAPAELQFTEGELDQLMADPDRMLELASLLHDRFKNGDKFAEGESGKGYSTKSDLRRAAKNWVEHRDNAVEAPRTDNERAFQQQVAEAAQRKIKRKTGLDISIADIQAALWYHEKELFEFLGAGSTKSAPADYADAAAIFEETYNSGKLFDVKGKPIKGREHDYTQFTEDSGPQFSPLANVAGGEGVRGVAEGSSYGTGIEGSVAVEATHYSREERSELDSSQYGSGRPGAERGRLSRPDADPAVRNRVFFYVDEGNGVDPETGVGGTPHNVSLENLYPARQDPLGFRAAAAAKFPTDYDARANFFESEVVKAGFDGLYDYGAFGKQGVAVLLGNHKVPVAPGVATGPAQRAPEKTSQETQADALAASSLPGGRMRASAWINKIAGTEFDTAANRAALEARGGDLLYRSDLAELFAAKPEAKPRRMSDEQTRNAKVEALRAKLGWPEGSLVQKAPGDRLLVQAVRAVSRVLGIEIIFVDTPNAEHGFNGVVNPSDPNTLFLNVKGDAPMLSIIGHEFIHTLANTNRALFAKVGVALLKANGVSKADLAEYKKWVNANRTKLGQKPIDDVKAMEEMIADFSGQTWNSKEFWGALADSNPSVFKQVADGFMNIINKLLSGISSNQTLRGSKYMRDVETTRDLLVEMMNELEAKGEQAGAETDPDFLPAYHGTGGSVDRFSTSKIGTGEGNAAFGWGLYFASKPEVADFYRRKLSKGDNQGNLYKVEIAPEENQLLKWDSAIANQSPEVRKALESLNLTTFSVEENGTEVATYSDRRRAKRAYPSATVKEVAPKSAGVAYRMLEREFGEPSKLTASRLEEMGLDPYGDLGEFSNDQLASMYLHSIGVRGVKFLDSSSRARGEGGYNYVVFNDADVEITAANADAYADATLDFSPRQKPDPEKTIKAYKLFNAKGGELFPLYINADQPTPIGEWLDADIGDNENSKIGKLAQRPGWHMGDSPAATHIGGKDKGSNVPTFRKPDQVWAEVSVAADRDWQTEANKRARTYKSGPRKGEIVASSAEIRGEIPEDGFYRYKTNPNMQGSWIIGGAIKLERILSDEDVAAINAEAGVQDLPRQAPLDTAALGFEEDVMFSPKSQAFKNWFGDSKVVDEDGNPQVVYHNTTYGDFNTFDKSEQRSGTAGFGFYFTDRDSSNIYADHAQTYKASRSWKGEEKKVNTMPVYLAMENPFMVDDMSKVPSRYQAKNFGVGREVAGVAVDAKHPLQKQGYDGVIGTEYVTRNKDGSYDVVSAGTKGAIAHPVYVVFEPNQIKSAVGNRGTFDPNQDDIAFAPLQTTDELDDLGELSWKTKTFTAVYDKYQAIIDTQKAVNKKYGEVTEAQNVNQAVTVHPGRLRARLNEFKDVYIEPLKRAIEESGMRPKDIGEFLLARHAREANAVLKARFPNRANNDRLSGMTDAQADRVLARYRGNANMQHLGSLIDSINTSRVNLMVRDGLMTQAEADAWSTNYSHYVPLNREEALDAMPSSGRGFDVGRKKASRLRGGSTKAVDTENMLARVLAQYEATLAWSEKNEVAKTFYRMAKNNPAPNLWVTDEVPTSPFLKADGTGTYRPNHMAPNVITAKINGETKYITLEDSNPYAKKILEAMQNLDTNESGILTQSLLTVNRYLAAINTSLSPEFVISNMIRDWQTAAYNLTNTELRNMKAKVLFNAGAAIKGIHNALRGDNSSDWAGYYQRFAKAGGMTGWVQSYEGVGDRMKSLQRDIKYGNMAGIKQAKATFEAINDYNTIVENGVRLSAFRAAVDSGMSDAKAAALAKELTVNFNRRGTWSLVMNALYLFSKASINGSGRILIAAMNPKNKMLHAMLAATVVFAAGLEILMQAMDDDDEYKLIDDSVKDRNLVIMDPFGFADAGYYKIPLPWGYNVFHVLGQEIGKGIMAAAGENPSWSAGEAAARTALSMLHAFNPVQDGSLLQTLSPTILDPFTRAQENKNWHGGSLYPDFNAHQADYKKYFRNAREESVELAKLMHDMTLDDATQKAILDVSPATLDMVYDFYTGSLGRVVADSASLAKVVVTGGEIPEVRKLPMLRRIYGNLSDSDKQRVFYNRFDEMLFINQALTDTPDAEKRDLYESIGVRKDMIGMTKITKKQLSNLSKQRREAEKRGNDEAVKKIEARRLEVMNRFTTRYNKVVHGI